MAVDQEEMPLLNSAPESPNNNHTQLDGIDYDQRSLATSMIHEHKVSPPGFLRWLETLFQTRIPGRSLQDEATAIAMDDFAKGPLNMSAAFLGPALLTLANQSAQLNCETENSNLEDYNEDTCNSENIRIYGLRPSSVLAAASVVVTLVAAGMMPLLGAMVDFSPHRRTVGAYTAAVIVVLNACQTTISLPTWALLWVAKIVSDLLLVVHNVVTLAYLQNLTTDSHVLATYTTRFTILHFCGTITYVLVVVAIAKHLGGDKVTTARFATLISSTVGFVMLGYAWKFLFGNRPPLHRLKPGESLVRKGMSKLRVSVKLVWSNYPALKWLLLTLLWSPDPGHGQMLSLIITFETEFLKMTASQIAMFQLLILIFTIPGGFISRYVCQKYNALTSFRVSILSWASITALGVSIVSGPEDVPYFYMCGVLWGVCLGWLIPTQRVLFCTIVPVGQETEFMGLILCFHVMLGWLPPLLFGFMNESGFSMRFGLLSSDAFFILAVITSIGIGDYNMAVQQARDTKRFEDSSTLDTAILDRNQRSEII